MNFLSRSRTHTSDHSYRRRGRLEIRRWAAPLESRSSHTTTTPACELQP